MKVRIFRIACAVIFVVAIWRVLSFMVLSCFLMTRIECANVDFVQLRSTLVRMGIFCPLPDLVHLNCLVLWLCLLTILVVLQYFFCMYSVLTWAHILFVGLLRHIFMMLN